MTLRSECGTVEPQTYRKELSVKNWCYSPDLGETVTHAKNCPNHGNPDVGNRLCITKSAGKKASK